MTTDEPRPDDADESFDEYADLGATTENAMDIATTSMDRPRTRPRRDARGPGPAEERARDR